ncbi:MAG: hypothetical protein JOZ67_06230, partial [Gammaproteobacteria bacterium]|nr:hypothetical protein [Gammaproteobacteria bacterium]
MNVTNQQAQVGSLNVRRAGGAGLVLTLLAATAHAGPNEQAKRIYERIAGEPPPPAVLTQMAGIISAACPAGCAAGDPALVQAAVVA